MELLRRSAPARRQTRYTTTEQARRKSALQMLANTGKLTELIARTEGRLENAQNSSRIKSELAEMYDAAGQKEKSLALLSNTNLNDVDSTQALHATAKQFVSAGKMDEACEAYLKLLRRKPDLFDNEYYDIKRPFENRRRMGDLADLIIEVGIKKFRDYRVSELCSELLRQDGGLEKARMLYAAIIEAPAIIFETPPIRLAESWDRLRRS